MRNIISIFLSDCKRIFTNVVAVVIIMGLSVIPCLYAWFNIFSNWAPYEEDATKNLKVAVASEDEGVSIKDVELNVGEKVISNLETNKSINWIFLDNSYDAIEGVKRGDYYAAFVIDKNFSNDMISFIGGDVKHPVIKYYENDKKNAIAPKITGKVKTTLQEGINQSFVQTLAKSALSISSELNSDDIKNKLGSESGTLFVNTNEDLDAMINVLDSYISLTKAASNAVDAAKAVSEEVDNMKDGISGIKDNSNQSIDSTTDGIDSLKDLVSISLAQAKTDLKMIDQKAESLYKVANAGSGKANARLDTVKTLVEAEQTRFNTVRKSVKNLGVSVPASVTASADKVDSDYTALSKDISEIEKYNTALPKDAKSFYNLCKKDIAKCEDDIDELKKAYQREVSPAVNKAIESAKATANNALGAIDTTDKNLTKLVAILDSYPDVMSLDPEKLESAKSNLIEIKAKINELEIKLGQISSTEQYGMLVKLLRNDPEAVAEFLTNPVAVETKELYPYENNGSAMAPFYIVLSIWVGALIMVAVIHTRVQKKSLDREFNHVQEFFGRYLFFFFIGQIQTLITVVGALLFVGIQCEHPFLLWFAMSITSFCFTILLYSLVFAFDAIGEALAVVMMVLQVAGSGGTFPVEVLPEAYNVMYKYMPFVYGSNAAKEAIAGMYKDFYIDNIKVLFIYIAIALVIGLLISVPLKKVMEYIKESTEKTDLVI